MGFISDTREVLASRELLVNLVRRELRSKYKGTTLGWAWSLINPLATTAIFTAIFSTIMRVDPPVGVNGLHNYALFLLCGLLTWNFMATAVVGSQGSLVVNGNLIKKTYFPRRLLVLSTVAAAFVSYLIEMAVLLVIFLIARVNVLPWIPLVLVVMIGVAVFSLGLGLILASVNVYFRDVAHFVSLFMQLWFYATPIIYPISLIRDIADGDSWAADLPLETLYQLNPMAGLVEAMRDLVYAGTMPDWRPVLYCAVVIVLLLLVGNRVFGRLEPRLAEEL